MKNWEINISQKIKNAESSFGISGRTLGHQQRKLWNVDEEENNCKEITVIFPENFLFVSSSFFLGFLGKSVRKCGSREKFLEKFKFKCSDSILKSINEGIKDALRDGSGIDL